MKSVFKSALSDEVTFVPALMLVLSLSILRYVSYGILRIGKNKEKGMLKEKMAKTSVLIGSFFETCWALLVGYFAGRAST